MKRIISLLLAAMMVITMLPTVAIADELNLFAADEQPVAEAPTEEPTEEPVEEQEQQENQLMAVLEQTLGDEKSTAVPKITKIAFEGNPAFDSNILFYNQPEGTIFQLDESGNRTDKTGISDDCFNYAVYVNKGTLTVKVAGSSGIKVKNNFAYTPERDENSKAYASKVYVIENGQKEYKIENNGTYLNLCMKLASTNFEMEENKLVVGIEFYTNGGATMLSEYKFNFIKEVSAVEAIINTLQELDLTAIEWPKDCDYINGLAANFNELSEGDKEQVSAELKAKLEQAVEILSENRVPAKLEVTTMPDKLYYGPNEAFDTKDMIVTATYADGRTRILDKDSYYTVTPEGEVGDVTEVVITYNTVSVNLPITVVKTTFAGEGTEENPYLISTASDLEELRLYVSIGLATEGRYYKMVNDITLPEGWQPIGCLKKPNENNDIEKGANLYAFSGTFDGDGYTLTVPKGGLPLLGYVKNAEVKNLNIYGEQIDGYGLVNNFEGVGLSGNAIIIDNVTIKSGTKILKSGFLGAQRTTNLYAGVSAAFVATIRNCTIEKDVIIGYTGELEAIGSFAGYMQGYIENCVSYATVKGKNRVGGIAAARDNAMGACEITNCQFHGTVEGESTVGGIIGSGYCYNYSAPNGVVPTIQNCIVTGTVKGVERVGGILGSDPLVAQSWGDYSITGNKFAGKVIGKKYVGGIIGYLDSINKHSIIENNTYYDDCGAERGIGYIKYIDTSYENPTVIDDGIVFNTAVDTKADLPVVSGCSWLLNKNRDDDPLGADADKLAKAIENENRVIAREVSALIDAIGKVELTPACQSKIYAARKAYDALTEEQKNFVDNYQKLLDAENDYYDLVHADDEPIHIVIGAATNAAAKGEENPNTGAEVLSIAPVVLVLKAVTLPF